MLLNSVCIIYDCVVLVSTRAASTISILIHVISSDKADQHVVISWHGRWLPHATGAGSEVIHVTGECRLSFEEEMQVLLLALGIRLRNEPSLGAQPIDHIKPSKLPELAAMMLVCHHQIYGVS